MCRSIPVRTLNFAAISGHIIKYVKKKQRKKKKKKKKRKKKKTICQSQVRHCYGDLHGLRIQLIT